MAATEFPQAFARGGEVAHAHEFADALQPGVACGRGGERGGRLLLRRLVEKHVALIGSGDFGSRRRREPVTLDPVQRLSSARPLRDIQPRFRCACALCLLAGFGFGHRVGAWRGAKTGVGIALWLVPGQEAAAVREGAGGGAACMTAGSSKTMGLHPAAPAPGRTAGTGVQPVAPCRRCPASLREGSMAGAGRRIRGFGGCRFRPGVLLHSDSRPWRGRRRGIGTAPDVHGADDSSPQAALHRSATDATAMRCRPRAPAKPRCRHPAANARCLRCRGCARRARPRGSSRPARAMGRACPPSRDRRWASSRSSGVSGSWSWLFMRRGSSFARSLSMA